MSVGLYPTMRLTITPQASLKMKLGGAAGPAGLTGPTGPIGLTGPIGPTGPAGVAVPDDQIALKAAFFN